MGAVSGGGAPMEAVLGFVRRSLVGRAEERMRKPRIAAEWQVREKALAEENSVDLQLNEVLSAVAQLNNAYDPWAALKMIDPDAQDDRSALMVERKIATISAQKARSRII